MAVTSYTNSATLNTDIVGINIGEGCNPANINNAIRQLMADIATFIDGPTFDGPVLLPNGTAALPALAFSSDTNIGLYRVGADELGFSTAGTLRWSLDSTGNWKPNASTLGVYLSGSGSNNLLRNYDEGTWTPTFTCATPGDLSIVYGTRTATYTRIGRFVFINFTMTWTPTFTTASGAISFGGLPIAVVGSVATGLPSWSPSPNTYTGTGSHLVVRFAAGTTTFSMRSMAAGVSTGQTIAGLTSGVAYTLEMGAGYQV